MRRFAAGGVLLLLVGLWSTQVTAIEPAPSGVPAHREVIVDWRWDVDTTRTLDVSTRVRATGVLLNVPPDQWRTPDAVLQQVRAYRARGFDVYLYFGTARIRGTTITPDHVAPFLAMAPVKGIAVNFFGRYDPREAERALATLAAAARAHGKTIAYYHGDGLSTVDARRLSASGLIVWAWFSGVWKPRTWDVQPIWAQLAVFNRDTRYTTRDAIVRWYRRLPRRPEAILWWQTTNRFNPTAEQVEGMREVAEMYLSPSATPGSQGP